MKIAIFATLHAVLDTGTLVGAARRLHLTPSAVSMQMKQLEHYVGQQLFDRSGLEIKALPAAHDLGVLTLSLLDKLEAFRRQKTIVVEGHVTMGIIESLQPVLLPHVLRLLRARYPRLQLQTRRGKSSELTNAVKSGELDAAVVAQPERGGSSRLHWHHLMDQPLSLIVPPSERARSLPLLLARYDWIRYDRSTVSGGLAARYINHHVPDKVRDKQNFVELDGVRAIAALVSAGLGISIVQLTEPGVHTLYPVNVVPLHDAPVVRYALVMRHADVDDRPLSALTAILQTVVQGEKSNAGAADAIPDGQG